jgi:hypothetical protein
MINALRWLFAQRAWWVLAALLLFVLLLRHGARPAPPGLCVLGDARAFHAAAVPAEFANQLFNAAPLRAGFGVASRDDWSRLGEALVFEGRLYTRPTDPQARDYYQLDASEQFRTTAFAALPADAVTRERVVLRAGQRFDDLWRELGAQFPEGALAVGLVEFRRLQTLAISRPATHGLPVFSSSALYYTEPMETRNAALAIVVGLAAHRGVLSTRSGEELFARLVARRPDGRADLYAQALVLDTPRLTSWGQLPRPLPAQAVGRIAAASIIERGEILLYPATQLSDCPALRTTDER